MLLSLQQRYILDVLEKLRYVRYGQLLILTREHFRRSDLVITPQRMDAMLRQLHMGAEHLRMEGDLISLKPPPHDALYLEAVDVMLEVSEGKPLDMKICSEQPQLLRFTLGESSVQLFTVAHLSEPAPTLPGRDAPSPVEQIIWLTGDSAPPSGLTLPARHYLAVRKTDGTHRFYGSSES